MLHDPTLGNGVNVVDLGEEVKSVGDKDLCSTFRVIQEHLLEHRLPNMGIQGRKGILGMPRQPIIRKRNRK